jgi:hypothetical protein
VLRNRGDGSFRPKVDYRVGARPRSVAIVDLNRDGEPDLVAAVGTHRGKVSVLLNRGNASFHHWIDYASGTGLRSAT